MNRFNSTPHSPIAGGCKIPATLLADKTADLVRRLASIPSRRLPSGGTLEQNIMPSKITFIISHTRRKSGFDRDFATQKNFCAARACAPTRRCIGLPAMVPLGDQNVVRAATLEATAAPQL